MRSKT